MAHTSRFSSKTSWGMISQSLDGSPFTFTCYSWYYQSVGVGGHMFFSFSPQPGTICQSLDCPSEVLATVSPIWRPCLSSSSQPGTIRQSLDDPSMVFATVGITKVCRSYFCFYLESYFWLDFFFWVDFCFWLDSLFLCRRLLILLLMLMTIMLITWITTCSERGCIWSCGLM